jgi:NAD(P)-dependent dehydrogenase (short-subunit alcohol dehydrogenase family)
MQAAADAFGRVDVLVNNAGIYPLASLLEMTEEAWDQVVDANLRSVHACTQAAARRMIAQARARHRERRLHQATTRRAAQPLRRGQGGRRDARSRGAGWDRTASA